MKQKVIIDCDPGQDDAVAILLALACPDELEVLGIVAVAGNVPLHYTSMNHRKILELAGRFDVPAFAGCARPIYRELVTAEHVHGKTGLDGPDLPAPTIPLQNRHGVDFIIETLLAGAPGEITLCTLGPLTDIAMALVKAPEIKDRIRRIVMMAGAYFEVGNIAPAGEFNVFVDPEAADLVLQSGIDVIMVPLDLTHQVLSTRARLDRIGALGNGAGRVVAEMLSFSEHFDLEKYGWGAAPLHDPCVIAYLLNPDLFSGRKINVSIETGSKLTLGMTVADWWQITNKPRNATYLRHVDVEGFYELLTERLARLP